MLVSFEIFQVILLVCTIGICSAATIYNVQPVRASLPINNEQASDLEGAESAQFGYGGYGGYGGSPYGGYGGFDNFGGGYGGIKITRYINSVIHSIVTFRLHSSVFWNLLYLLT